MRPCERERAAGHLSRARVDHVRLEDLPDPLRPTSETEAYAVQDVLHGVLSDAGLGTVAGHKIGCTTPVMQEYLRISNPCAGGVFNPTVRHEDGTFPHEGFLHVGVECEIAVRLGSGLAAGGAPYTRESVAPAVDAVMAAIEVVDDRWTDFRSVDTFSLIADDFFGAGCVLGRPVIDWEALDLPAAAGSMSINGEPVGAGSGGDIMGHPFEALAWLANSLAGRGAGLQAGEFVLLGSVVETHWVEKGDVVAVEIDGLVGAVARFP